MEKEKTKINISVRGLVEFIMRAGDLDSRFMGSSRAQEGTRIHKKLQKSNEKLYYSYASEVSLKHIIEYEEFQLLVEGRADGIITDEKGNITIDEIKSTHRDLSLIDEDYNILHWAQAMCYGYIYGVQNNLENIKIQVTYCELANEQVKSLIRDFDLKELREFFMDLVDKYYGWAKEKFLWQHHRTQSIKELNFPFPSYRRGQRELAVAAYKTIQEGKKLFAQAPTGIGKTISTLFPAVKAMGEGMVSKIFYLTAKTITRTVAEEAAIRLKDSGLHFRNITLTAKDKICFKCTGKDREQGPLEEKVEASLDANKPKASCTPEQCEYAKGHFDRVNRALEDIISNEHEFTRDKIEVYSKKHQVCPFEFSLDLALWADLVICDYNYAFDPRAYLRRFFENNVSDDYAFLIDESHNLVDRSREMFSAELFKSNVLKCKKLMKGRMPSLYKSIDKINSYFIQLRHLCEEKNASTLVNKEEPGELYPMLKSFMKESEEYLVKNRGTEGYEDILQLYFDINGFLSRGESYDERFVTYIDTENSEVKLKLYCVDPSYLLKEATGRAKAAVFFSATLTPMEYFKEVLGGGEEDYKMRLPSPFHRENLSLNIVSNLSTRYVNRESSYEEIARYIKTFTKSKKGNYMIFFPSYIYMNKVHEMYKELFPDDTSLGADGQGAEKITLQDNSMTEENREEFLNNFQKDNDHTLIAFVVMGGIFSEGIDLVGDRLIGAIIVGVGLPQICLERNIIKEYYGEKRGQFSKGFEYSYIYPGMNKVLQAAGRVIRTEQDKGAVVLIDDRFASKEYQRLFPEEWKDFNIIKSTQGLEEVLREFWKAF